MDNEYSLSTISGNLRTMPDNRKEKTRAKLRDAVVSETIEQGFGAVSISGVVKRAQVSAGTVYVHYETKDDMLQKVFLEIKREFHAILLLAQDELQSDGLIRRLWFDVIHFASERPSDFLFLEYGSAAHFLTAEQKSEIDSMHDEINTMVQRGVNDGTLVPLDISMVSLLLIAPAMQLARSAALTTESSIPADTIEQLFEQVWRSIAVDPLSTPPKGNLA